MTWLRRTCEDHQRLWLLRADGGQGWLASRANDRHLAGCAECRGFAAAAADVTRRVAGAAAIAPSPDLVRAISRRAADRWSDPATPGVGRNAESYDPAVGGARTGAPGTEQQWWAGAFMGGALLAAAAGLVLAFLRPAAFSGQPVPPSRLEARLSWAQQELDQFAAEPPARPGRMSLDDRIRSAEQQLRCLDVDLDDVNWNTLKQDSACTDS